MITNFTPKAIGLITANLSPVMTVRINKSGNISLRHYKGAEVQFVIYNRPNGYYIRRRIDTKNPYGVGHVLNNEKPFESIADLVDYFKDYMSKYPSHLVKAFK